MAGRGSTRDRKPGNQLKRDPVLKFSDQHRLFVEAYVNSNGSAKDAAIKAGVPPSSAASMGAQWLNADQYPLIAKAINARFEERRNTTEVDAKRVLQEAARIGFFNPKELLRPDGKGMMNLAEMPDHVAAVIANISVTFGEDVDTDTEGNVTFSRVKHVHMNFHNKLNALNLIANLLGLTRDDSPLRDGGPDSTTPGIQLKWEELYRQQLGAAKVQDPIQARIEAEFAKARAALPAHSPQESPAPPAPLNVVDSNEPEPPQASDRPSVGEPERV